MSVRASLLLANVHMKPNYIDMAWTLITDSIYSDHHFSGIIINSYILSMLSTPRHYKSSFTASIILFAKLLRVGLNVYVFPVQKDKHCNRKLYIFQGICYSAHFHWFEGADTVYILCQAFEWHWYWTLELYCHCYNW